MFIADFNNREHHIANPNIVLLQGKTLTLPCLCIKFDPPQNDPGPLKRWTVSPAFAVWLFLGYPCEFSREIYPFNDIDTCFHDPCNKIAFSNNVEMSFPPKQKCVNNYLPETTLCQQFFSPNNKHVEKKHLFPKQKQVDN